MGAQQEILEASLLNAGWRPRAVPRPTAGSLAEAGLAAEVDDVYRRLGGTGTNARIVPGGWDFPAEPCVVELDEQRHFNRYRSATLDSVVYDATKVLDRDEYRRFCDTHEDDCLRRARHGGYWATPVSDREFGSSGPLGVLDGAGPSRWRQRAFYDFVKDAWALATNVPMIRLAVWEVLDDEGSSVTLGRALTRLAKTADPRMLAAVLGHVEGRVADRRA